MRDMLVVEYLDDDKLRWGFITKDAYKVFFNCMNGDTRISKETRVTVYLFDGTTGDASLEDLSVTSKFAVRER